MAIRSTIGNEIAVVVASISRSRPGIEVWVVEEKRSDAAGFIYFWCVYSFNGMGSISGPTKRSDAADPGKEGRGNVAGGVVGLPHARVMVC
jgi:hypothetical protein